MSPDTGNQNGERKAILALKKLKDLTRLTPDSRFYLFLIALALVIGGQIIMHRDIPLDSWQDMRQTINDWLRIDAKYLGNVILGMACTMLGGVIFAVTSFRSGAFKLNTAEIFPLSNVPILNKFHLSKWVWRMLLGLGLFAILIIRAVNYELEFFDVFNHYWVLVH